MFRVTLNPLVELCIGHDFPLLDLFASGSDKRDSEDWPSWVVGGALLEDGKVCLVCGHAKETKKLDVEGGMSRQDPTDEDLYTPFRGGGAVESPHPNNRGTVAGRQPTVRILGSAGYTHVRQGSLSLYRCIAPRGWTVTCCPVTLRSMGQWAPE